MENNPYLKKLQSQWEQLNAAWQQEKAQLKNKEADIEIENSFKELQTQFDAAGKLTEAKLKEWGAQAEQEMQKLRLKFSSPTAVVEKVKQSVASADQSDQ